MSLSCHFLIDESMLTDASTRGFELLNVINSDRQAVLNEFEICLVDMEAGIPR
jgi:hypothetical protein